MPTVELKLADIYYESVGTGPPLVFAHGAGGNSLSWWQQTAFFGAGYRCITFDHPGFRHSTWKADESDSRAIYANALAELLDHLEIERVGLVAQSMGGWTCLRFALDHPDRVGALVLAATDGGLCLPDQNAYLSEEKRLTEIRRAWKQQLPGSFHPAAGKRMLDEQPDLHEMYVEISRQNGGASTRGWGEINSAELSSLACPTLLIVGEEDIICHPGRMRALTGAIDGCELVQVPQAGHSVYFERPEVFNQTVDEFLSRTYPSGPTGRTILETFKNTDSD